MTPTCRSPPALRKDLLTVLPGRMVNAKPPPLSRRSLLNQPQPRPPLLPYTLKSFDLSNIDQLYDDYTSIALFYERGSANIAPILCGALEELLVHFPAAAGRFRFNELEGRLEVAYSSAPSPAADTLQASGVQFVAAHADIAFSELGDVSAPHSSFDLLYPTLLKDSCQGCSANLRPYPIVAIQVTTFTCGGFTLAFMSNHAFMDGHGVAVFLQNLCSIARGKGVVSLPETLSRREVMKPRMPPSPMFNHSYITSGPWEPQCGTATRFTFSTAALEALRLKGSGQQAKKQCSRFQALVALLWTAQAKSAAVVGGNCRHNEELPIRLPVNLREREVPTVTQGYTGNGTLQCMVRATVQELCESSLECVVQKIKTAMASIMPEYAQSETDYVELLLKGGCVPHLDQSCLAMPCLVHLPFYDTDCGWGCPVYCGRPSKEPFQRMFVLDHPVAGAWNVVNAFRSDEERVAFQEAIAEYTTSHKVNTCVNGLHI